MMLSPADCDNSYDLCRQLGVSSYLVKPLKQSELLDKIVDVLYTAEGHARTESIALSNSAVVAKFHIRPLKLLLAEDNFVNQQLMIRILESQGHQVFLANNGREACDYLQSHSADIVLMDVQMPEMDGMQATAEIRSMQQDKKHRTPIVALTAHALKGDRANCLAAGMDAYVSKPIHPAELNAVIADLVGEAEPESQFNSVADNATPVFDKDDLISRVGDDLDFLEMILGVFCDDYPTHLQTIEDAIRERNPERLHAAAHTLKGSASNMGGKLAAERGLALETLANDLRFDECPAAAERLSQSLNELVLALQAEITTNSLTTT